MNTTANPFPVRCLRSWSALEVGRTPHRALPLDGPAVLRHYQAARPDRQPIFLLYAMVNRPYVLGLLPGRSVVEALVQAGHDVFLLDWGRPGREEAERDIDSYLDTTVLGAVKKALRVARAKSLTLLGYCQGGTYAALFAARHPRLVRRLALMAAPIDFDLLGPLTTWSRMPWFDPRLLSGPSGNASGLALHWGFETLRPFETQSRYLRMWERGLLGEVGDDELEHFLAMELWVHDAVDHPGRAFHEFHERFYRANELARGRTLSAIRCPAMLIVGTKDHLIPPASTLSARGLLGSLDLRVLECDCGHIGLSVSSKAHREVWPEVMTWTRS